jgi:RNA polymerase sigma-70 factor (ECF subfamily)
MTDDAKQLLLRCFEGDKASWDRFVQDYAGLIYHTIKKTLALHRGSKLADSAEDIFQDTFLSLVKDEFAQLRRFRGDNGCTLASWLRMIAARRTIDHLRKSNQPANLEESLLDGLADESNEGSDEQLQLLARVLPELQPRERIIIDLFFRQSLSAPDVASILHLSVGAVYTQKSRILAKLREALQKSGPL